MTTCVKCLPGKLIRESVPKLLPGTSHIGPLGSACTKIPDTCTNFPEGKQTFSINHILVQFRHSEPFLSILGIVGTLPKYKFSDTNQKPTQQTRLFKDSSLKSAMFFSAQLHTF